MPLAQPPTDAPPAASAPATPLLDVALAPGALAARTEMPLPARTVYIVVDVVRATTTLATQFERGARQVYVAGGIAQARAARQALAEAAPDGPAVLLAGESGGLAPAGFDYGNSPAEFARLDLTGAELVFATTNGTRALLACAGGAAVLAGALRNADAVANAAVALARPDAQIGLETPATPEPVGYTHSIGTGEAASEAFSSAHHRAAAAIVVVCSGRGGLPAYDDTVCAGIIAARVRARLRERDRPMWLGEGARIALGAAADAKRMGLREALAASDAGRAIAEVGLEADLDWCAAVDVTDVVPYVAGTGRDGLLVVRHRGATEK